MVDIDALKYSGKVIVDEDHDWGYQLRFVNEDEYCGKFLVLENTEWGSFHFHHKKKETFVIIAGAVEIFREDVGIMLFHVGDQYTFDPNIGHKIRAGKDYIDKDGLCVMLEVSTHDSDLDTYLIKQEAE